MNLNGPGTAVEALAAELCAAGARRIDVSSLVTTEVDGIDAWTAVSSRHPRAVIGLECFEAFGDELLQAVIENGRVTVMARRGVLPEGWGSVHDEDGEPLDAELLRDAARVVAAAAQTHDVGAPTGGLEIALATGKLMGSFCERAEASALGDPSGPALEGVAELAVLALWVSAHDSGRNEAEREYEQALRLAQSAAHASSDELLDRRGSACWSEWLELLLSSAGYVIEAACHCCIERGSEAHAFGVEQYGTPEEQLESEGSALLTSCLQALALFADDERLSAHAVA